jgi:hypothetical protein
MPKSPEDMVQQVIDQEDAEFRALETFKSLTERYARAQKGSKMFEVVTEIYSLYLAHWAGPSSVETELPATTFDYLTEPVVEGGRGWSRPTVIKAKKILGIRSIRKDKLWWWAWPLRAPEKALQEDLDIRIREAFKHPDYRLVRERLGVLSRPGAKDLLGVMHEHRYYAPAEVVRGQMYDEFKMRKQKLQRLKSSLGIVSYKNPEDGLWYWVHPAREVQVWLLDMLSDGPVTFVSLFEAARAKGWDEVVVRMAKLAVGGITACSINGAYGWRMR